VSEGNDAGKKGKARGNGDLAKVQSLLGGLIAAFAAVLSFVGIRSSEIADILRNQEPIIGLVSFAFLLSILVAVLAMLNQSPHTGQWPTKGITWGTLLLLAGIGALLTVFIRIPLVTTPLQEVLSVAIGGVLLVVAVALLIAGRHPVTPAEKEEAAPADGRRNFRAWLRDDVDRQQYFVLTSILLLAIAAYSAIRVESASQDTPFAQVTATLGVSSSGAGLDTLTVSTASQKVPIPDRVDILVRGLPRGVNVAASCQGTMPPNPDAFPCQVAPCDYLHCKTLVGWVLPPDAQGSVRQTLVLPFSAALYQRLQVLGKLCQRTRANGFCLPVKAAPAVGTDLELQVAEPSAQSSAQARPARRSSP